MGPPGPPGLPGPGGLNIEGRIYQMYRNFDIRPVSVVFKTHWWP